MHIITLSLGYFFKQGPPQGPQKLSSLKSPNVQNHLPKNTGMCHDKISEMASSSNSRWQHRKDCPNRSKNNGDMAEIAKRPASDGESLCHLCNYIIIYLSYLLRSVCLSLSHCFPYLFYLTFSGLSNLIAFIVLFIS